MLLHQPVGSGALMPSSSMSSVESGMKTGSSRWQLTFGTGAIGNATQPSLTGSLLGLAKDLVYGGSGGSLEEERKRVWNMKDLPVLETGRSLLGVDIKVKEGEARECEFHTAHWLSVCVSVSLTYGLGLSRLHPSITHDPPSHSSRKGIPIYLRPRRLTKRGASGTGEAAEIQGHLGAHQDMGKCVSQVYPQLRCICADAGPVAQAIRTYDVLKPVIHIRTEGEVVELVTGPSAETKRRSSPVDRGRSKGGDTKGSLQAYAKHLLDTLDPPILSSMNGHVLSSRAAPLSPSRVGSRNRVLSPSSRLPDLPPASPPLSTASKSTDRLDVPLAGNLGKGLRPRRGSFVDGDDELVEEGGDEGGCGEAVEILSRHSVKSE